MVEREAISYHSITSYMVEEADSHLSKIFVWIQGVLEKYAIINTGGVQRAKWAHLFLFLKFSY